MCGNKKLRLGLQSTTEGQSVTVMQPAFPEEILEMIFNKLATSGGNSTSLVNLCQASEQYNRILYSSVTNWLVEQIFPMVFPYLDKTDILTCRLISKSWNSAVTQFIRNYRRSLLGSAPCASSLRSKGLEVITFSTSAQLQEFQRDMETHRKTGRNPFVMPRVIINNIEIPFRPQFLKLLASFGNHITDLCIDGEHNIRITNLTRYKFLQNILRKTPNLKSLNIDKFFYRNCKGSMSELESYVESNSLPKLPLLTSFRYLPELVYEGRQHIVAPILFQYTTQLKRLATHNIVYNNAIIDKVYCPQFLNLEELEITLDVDLNNHAFDWLLNLIAPKLRKLTLVGNSNIVHPRALHLLFGLIQKVCPTLRYLSVLIKERTRYTEDVLCFENLEGVLKEITSCPVVSLPDIVSLEIRNISFDDTFVNFPFHLIFKQLPNLERIVLLHIEEMSVLEEYKYELDLELWISSGLMYQCPVWTMLPKLKEFITGRFGNQDGRYEYYEYTYDYDEMDDDIEGLERFTRARYEYALQNGS